MLADRQHLNKCERGSPRDIPFKISSMLAMQFQRRSCLSEKFTDGRRTDGRRTTRHPISSAGLWPVELMNTLDYDLGDKCVEISDFSGYIGGFTVANFVLR